MNRPFTIPKLGPFTSRASVVVLFVIGFLALAADVRAQGIPIPHGKIDLLAENSWITPGRGATLGLRFKMDRGWHIYWVNPGDSGEPPRVTWQLPAGLTAGEMEWPAPQKMAVSTIMNYVYDGDVLILVPIRAAPNFSAPQPVKLDAAVRFLICSEKMCVPGKAQLSLTLPVKSQAPSPDKAVEAEFSTARARLPKPAPANWKSSVREEKDSFLLDVASGQSIAQAYFFPEEESQIDNAAAQTLTPTPTGMKLLLRKSGDLTKPISHLKGVLVLQGGEAYALDVRVVSGAGKP